jgi:hypothetical protein
MSPRYRSLVPPAVLILAFTAGGVGCDTEASRRKRAEEAARNRAWEDDQRHKAEVEPPTAEVTEQVNAATRAFMEERHADLNIEGITFTPMTPNLFLVGVAVHDPIKSNRYVAQLTAERLRDGTWGEGGQVKENGDLVWVMDYADAERMHALAVRHGFDQEVDRIRDLDRDDRDDRYRSSWGHRSWLDNYLLWAVLFHRPGSYGYRPGGGFMPLAPGYRFNDPGRPITPVDAQRFQAAAAPTNGRSMVFLGGSAWRPPMVSPSSPHTGTAFVAGRSGITGKSSTGSVSRGGFGGAGHASGTGG